MTLQFSSLVHCPVQLPVWHTILDDLGRPPPARIAKALGIGERTVYRYNRDGQAPRACTLALFWLTRWGRGIIDAQAVNDARLAVGYFEALRRQVAELERENARLLALGHSGAANDPTLRRPHV